MNLLRPCLLLLTGAASWLSAAPASAGQGRLLATGGATQIEGAAGGGIVPWAVLSGYGTDEQHGGAAFYTRVDTGDYALDAYGASYTFGNRLEVSFARQSFDLGELQRRLSLPWDSLDQDVYGAKLRMTGDLVYGRSPQISVGMQHKRLRDGTLPLAIGARDDSGTDAYVSASKLFLDAAGGYQLLLNATLRSSNANQAGLLGFGGDRRADRTWLWEGSAAVLLDPRFAVGVEYRQKPDNLGFAREDDWRDLFIAWFPTKHVAVVGAWADLGSIATLDDQRGAYVSVQLSF
ncbi:DUF3034 family protein [Pseudoxanthomonas sp. PXM01]|uniref:DUF3034 family protein n=1 Tax=Pseudoxanthomonas sp. PXM01 TaxID=2769295 RepID=UPI0017857647|nr:DUF3034 family protein [Pseudoxanthomonas sp. PXM01]MBD9468193.1 DUF3034 family protein [Pseudoxanthomonas sp. PXM01]